MEKKAEKKHKKMKGATLSFEKDEKKSIIIALVVSAVVILAFVLAFVAIRRHKGSVANDQALIDEYMSEIQYSESGSIVVVNQEELNLALEDEEVTSILLQTEEEISIIIPEGAYSDKEFIVDSPYAEVTNYGYFSNISILRISSNTWTEGANSNNINISAPASHIVVPSGYEVYNISNNAAGATLAIECSGTINKLDLNAADSITSLQIDGAINKINVNSKTNLNISGSRSMLTDVETAYGAENTMINTSIPVSILGYSGFSATFGAGAEGSSASVADSTVSIVAQNDTSGEIVLYAIEEKDNVTIQSGESGKIEGKMPDYSSSSSSSTSSSTTSSSSSSSSGNRSSTSSSSSSTSSNSSTKKQTTTTTTTTTVTTTPTNSSSTTSTTITKSDTTEVKDLKDKIEELTKKLSSQEVEIKTQKEKIEKTENILERLENGKMVANIRPAKEYIYLGAPAVMTEQEAAAEILSQLGNKVTGIIVGDGLKEIELEVDEQGWVCDESKPYNRSLNGIYKFTAGVKATDDYSFLCEKKATAYVVITSDGIIIEGDGADRSDFSISQIPADGAMYLSTISTEEGPIDVSLESFVAATQNHSEFFEFENLAEADKSNIYSVAASVIYIDTINGKFVGSEGCLVQNTDSWNVAEGEKALVARKTFAQPYGERIIRFKVSVFREETDTNKQRECKINRWLKEEQDESTGEFRIVPDTPNSNYSYSPGKVLALRRNSYGAANYYLIDSDLFTSPTDSTTRVYNQEDSAGDVWSFYFIGGDKTPKVNVSPVDQGEGGEGS